MGYENEIKLRGPNGSIALTTDGTSLLVNGQAYPRKFNNIVQGRAVVAAPARACLSVVAPNNILAGRMPLKAYAAMSGIRVHYAAMATGELLPDNDVLVEAAIETAAGAIYQFTFGGQRFGRLDRAGLLSSDVALVDIAAGATYYIRTRILAPNNATNLSPLNGYTTLAADVTLGAGSVTLTDLPVDRPTPLRLRIAGAGAEVVEVIRMTTAASPYTATLRGTLAASHTAAGSVVGQSVWTSREIGSDEGGTASSASTTFDIGATAFSAASVTGSTTLAANASVGDTSIQVVAMGSLRGQTFTLDTAGNAETVVARTVVGTANPFTVYLASPLTIAHLSGVALANTNSGNSIIIPTPVAVTADYVASPPTTITLLGDSIAQGTGNYFRSWVGYPSLALEPTHPLVPLAKSGESAQQFAADTNGQQRRRLLDLGDWLLYAFGTNDIYGGRTLAQFQADTLTILGWARTRGMKIAVCTITPRSNSSDGWTTVSGQTEINAATGGLVRKAANAWIRAGAGGFADMVVEVADAFETGRDTGLVKADTNPGPYTVDGLHPSYSGHQMLARVVNAALFV